MPVASIQQEKNSIQEMLAPILTMVSCMLWRRSGWICNLAAMDENELREVEGIGEAASAWAVTVGELF